MPSTPSQCRTPRRVLQVITPSHMSGAEMQLVRMTPHMTARGHAVATMIKRGSPAIEEMHRLGLDTQALRISGKANVAALPILARAAKLHRADLIQSTLSTASWWSGWLERLGGPPSIGHVQGFTSATWHRHQSHLLAVSHAVMRHLVKQGIAPERFTVLHNAISPDDFFATRDPLLVRAELAPRPRRPSSAPSPTSPAKKATATWSTPFPSSSANSPRPSFGLWAKASSGRSCTKRPSKRA